MRIECGSSPPDRATHDRNGDRHSTVARLYTVGLLADTLSPEVPGEKIPLQPQPTRKEHEMPHRKDEGALASPCDNGVLDQTTKRVSA